VASALTDAQPREHRRPDRVRRLGERAAPTGAASPGLAAFQQNGCSSCHTFTPAAATGTIGPDLDKLKDEAAKAHRGSLAQFIQESIVDPGAYLEPVTRT
jgi:Cytochrome c551/c552